MSTLIAYHNDPALKAQIVELMQWHRQQDRLIKGAYQSTGTDIFRGCAVGCTLRTVDLLSGSKRQGTYDNHASYEPLIGVPMVLAWLQERLFESLPVPDNQAFAVAFLEAIPVGADLSLVWPHLAVWLLTDPTYGVAQYLGEQSTIADRVADLYRQLIAGEAVTQQWAEVRTAADNALIKYPRTPKDFATHMVSCAADTISITSTTLYAASAHAANAGPDAAINFWPSFRDKLLQVLAAAPLANR